MISTLASGCQTTSNPVIEIPDLSIARPERPILAGDYKNVVGQLIVYSNQMETYADTLEDYIVEINYILGQ